MAGGGIQVAHRQLNGPQIAKHRRDSSPMTSLTEELQGLGDIAGRTYKVSPDVQGEGPDDKQAAGQMGLLEAADQAQAPLDERQRGVWLPLVQQDGRMHVQEVSDEVVVAGGGGNGQRLLAVVPGDRIAARLLEEVRRRG